MAWNFWRNPEFVRHLRSELRRGRVTALVLIVIIVCTLTVLICWAPQKRRLETFRDIKDTYARDHAGAAPGSFEAQRIAKEEQAFHEWESSIRKDTSRNAFRALLFMQFGVLTFWSLLSCAQGISRERERGTWDFQRTTRMQSSELLVGKLFGEPIVGYFIVLCSMPISIALALEGRVGVSSILSAYSLMFIAGLFIGIAGLWLSSLFESRSRGIGLIGAFAMYAGFLGATGLAESPFSGLGALSPLTLLLRLTGRGGYTVMRSPTLFGMEVPWLLMSALLYATFGAWIVLMLARTLKKDLHEVRLLSYWEAVGCCAFLNFVLYATFNPAHDNSFQSATDFVTFMAGVNLLILFVLGLAMLTTPERLQAGERTAGRPFLVTDLLADDLPWPALLISGVVSYLLLIWGLYAWKEPFGFDRHTVAVSGVRFLVILVFATSDVLFIQWCKFTRLRAPLIKGVLLLCLYYAASAIVCAVLNVGSEMAAIDTANVLTPFAAFGAENHLLSVSTLFGVVLQLMVVAFMISAVRARVQQPKLIVAAA